MTDKDTGTEKSEEKTDITPKEFEAIAEEQHEKAFKLAAKHLNELHAEGLVIISVFTYLAMQIDILSQQLGTERLIVADQLKAMLEDPKEDSPK